MDFEVRVSAEYLRERLSGELVCLSRGEDAGGRRLGFVRMLSPDMTAYQPGALYLGFPSALPAITPPATAVIVLCGAASLPCTVFSIEQPGTASVLFGEIFEIFSGLSGWAARLSQAAQGEDAAARMVELSSAFFGRPLLALDASMKPFAAAGRDLLGEGRLSPLFEGHSDRALLTAELGPRLEQLPLRDSKATSVEGASKSQYMLRGIDDRGVRQGVLVLFSSGFPFRESDCETLDLLGEALGRLAAEKSFLPTADQDLARRALRDLLTGALRDGDTVRRRLRGLKLGRRSCLLRLSLPDEELGMSRFMCAAAEQSIGGLCAADESGLYMLCPVNDMGEYAALLRRLRSFLEGSARQAGVSDLFSELLEGRVHAVQAERALMFGRELRPKADLYIYRDYAVRDLYFRCGSESLEGIAHPALAFLASLDAEGRNDYYTTLRVYLEHERSVVDTAAALLIHRNTLSYRVEKISRLLEREYGQSLEDPSFRRQLTVSYEIMSFR